MTDRILTLNECGQSFRVMFEQHGAIMLLIDKETNDIVDANIAARKFYGYAKERLEGMNLNALDVLKNEKPLDLNAPMECIHRLSNGEIRDIQIYLSAANISDERSILFAVIQDVTQQKRTQEKLQKLNQQLEERVEQEIKKSQRHLVRFKGIFESSSVGICVIDRDGRLEEVNPAFATMLGYEVQELNGVKFSKITHPSDVDESQNLFNTLRDGYLEFFQIEKRYITKNGTVIVTATMVSQLRESDSEDADFFLAMVQNITEKKELEETRRSQEQMLIHQSKLATMGEMIGNIAHQWRQPLNAVGIIVQDVLDAYRYGEMDEEYLKKNVQQCMNLLHYMSKTIDDFRNFFRPNKQKVQFSLSDELKRAVSFIEAGLKSHGIDIVLNIEKEFTLTGYPGEFTQVILNLLSNAKDAIENKEIKQKGIISITLFEQDERPTITIDDNGGGIPDMIISRIFEPYFTTKEQGKGTGIGLYMSKMIIENNMYGKMSVSNIENGAQFKIQL